MPTDYKKIAEENIKKYGTDIGRYGPVLLAHLYSDRTHFIYEILQNAEDAGARAKKSVRISFHLFKNRLEVRHNGKLFDEADVQGICGLVEGTKKDDLTQIGKFGIGFKSVYAYTNAPHIYSGDETFCIENYVLPHAVEKEVDIADDKTLFIFPFNHYEILSEEAFKEISRRLREIGARSLIFLNFIEEIVWHIDGQESGIYIRDVRQEINHKKIYVISKVGEQNDKDEEWLIFEKPLPLETTLKVAVAFRVDRDKNNKGIIISAKDSKLIVFFPTEKPTYLNFLIHGPYRTTPNRENIPSEDKQNKVIIKETAELVAQSVSIIKELGYLDINFLNVLPLESKYREGEPIYAHIYNKVKETFLGEEELLPTHDRGFAKATDVLLADGPLTEIFDSDDINFLFSKRYWADTGITEKRTRELRDYLIKELQVKEVNFESFARKITAEFLRTKSDEWMIDFYSRLLEQQSLWSDKGYSKGILRTKPIIRLETNEHIAPFDDKGEIQVYLPSETKSKYKTVKRILTENEDSLKFLKNLGLTKPDLFAEIKEFVLPKYQTYNPAKDEGYFEDFEKLLTAYETIPANKKREFVGELSKASFIDSVHNGTGENHLRKPLETYFNDKDLKDYFDGHHSVYFVSNELYAMFGEERLKLFFIDLGVEEKPRRIEIKKVADLSWEEKVKLVGYTGRDVQQKDYEYEGLDNFINNMIVSKSFLLWKLLLKNIETLSSWAAQKFFEGKLEWEYYGLNNRSFDANFTRTLRQEAWLVDKNNNFRKPSEITFSELSDDYIKESPNIDILKKVLEFKPEIIDQLPEDYRRILEIVKDSGLSPEELEKLVSKSKKESSGKEEKTWTPEHEPGTVNVKIIEVEPDKIVTPDLTGQREPIGTEQGEEPTNEGEKPTEEDVDETPTDKKVIGKWGEEYVYHALKKEYQKLGSITETDSSFKVVNASNEEFEIIWLNKHHDRGKGYDFVIKKKEAEIEYIEVKTKTQEVGELIGVTGTQWEFARKLFEQNEGEKYSFYVVLNAGGKNAQIYILKNPIKLWKEGKLYAHPVNFKL